MADDESPKSDPEIVAPVTGPLPSREPRHDPGVIDGEATEIHHGASAEPEAEEAAESAAEPDEPAPQAAPIEEPAVVAASAPPSRAGWLFLAALVGALVGVVVALAVAWFFDPRAAAIDSAVSSLATLQHNAEAGSVANAMLDKRLRALETDEASAPKASAIDALGQRIAALEAAAKADAGRNTIAQSALDEAHAARADAAKALALASAAGAGSSGAGSSAAPPASSAAPAAPDTSALEARVGKLESDLAALKAAADLAPVNDRLAKLEAALAAPKSEARVAASASAPGGGAGAAVLAISLVERVNAGAPYEPELTALSRLGADGAKLDALKPFAQTGAPTLAALRAAFAKVAPAVAAAATPAQTGGVMDRLLDHLRQLVRVHKVGEAVGDDPEGLTAHIAAALARGDLAAAYEAYGRLPEAARQAAGDWGKLAQGRQAAGEAALALRADAVGRLAAAKD